LPLGALKQAYPYKTITLFSTRTLTADPPRMGVCGTRGLNIGSEPRAVNKIGEVNITMLCLTQALDRRSLNYLFRSVKGAVASEGVRQGQVPIMRIIGKGGFSKNNGEIGAPLFLR